MKQKPIIVWLRHDLRLHDNPALSIAAGMDRPILCLYIDDNITDCKKNNSGALCAGGIIMHLNPFKRI